MSYICCSDYNPITKKYFHFINTKGTFFILFMTLSSNFRVKVYVAEEESGSKTNQIVF